MNNIKKTIDEIDSYQIECLVIFNLTSFLFYFPYLRITSKNKYCYVLSILQLKSGWLSHLCYY